MADDAPFLPGLSLVTGKPVQVTCDAGRLSSDGGVLVLAEIERRFGIAERVARCIEDPRAPDRVQHGPLIVRKCSHAPGAPLGTGM